MDWSKKFPNFLRGSYYSISSLIQRHIPVLFLINFLEECPIKSRPTSVNGVKLIIPHSFPQILSSKLINLETVVAGLSYTCILCNLLGMLGILGQDCNIVKDIGHIIYQAY